MAHASTVPRGHLGLFSSRFSPRLPRPSTPSPLAGEGWDGGEKHGLHTPPAFTPTLALPRLRGREQTDRRGSRKLNGPVRRVSDLALRCLRRRTARRIVPSTPCGTRQRKDSREVRMLKVTTNLMMPTGITG